MTTALDSILAKTGLPPAALAKAQAPALKLVEAPNDLLRAALEYADLGYQVIPLHTPTGKGCSCGKADCASIGKHPRCKNGLKDATTNPAAIRQWWKQWPDANIGIATGPESNLLVLDIDGKQGEDSLIKLAREGCTLPDSYVVKTGSGQHIYFLYPSGRDVRNSASKLAPGLDIRGAGGYVVAPPSLYRNGTRYETLESSVPPVDAPEWLLTRLQEQKTPAAPASASAPATVAAPARLPKGKGDPAKLSLAGTMFRKNQPIEVIEAAVIALDKTCEHERGEADCKKKVAEWAKRYSQGQPLAEVNHASVEADVVTLSDVTARNVSWLWQPRLALGMVNELVGDTGVGKTTIAMNIAAEGSHGRLPDGGTCPPFDTLYLTHENPLAEVMRPKLDAMGGDPRRFHVLLGSRAEIDGEMHKGSVNLADVELLEKAIRQTGAKLVVFDPVQSYFGAGVDWNHANQTRPILDALNRLADSTRSAILLIRHSGKARGGKATSSGLGSIDQTATARSSLLAGVLPDDETQCALLHTKTNIGPRAPALGYKIDSLGRFSWTGVSNITAAELLASPEAPDRKLTEATQWLSDKLKGGSAEQSEIREQAEAAGLSYRTLVRAKTALRVKSRKASMGAGWFWWLPDAPESGTVQ
jgi:hypothetical protein